MTSWREARSLTTLIAQYNALFPGRSKASDGTIGDAAHAARESDHNPLNGIVYAFDLTHDPAHGVNIQTEAERLVNTLDPRIKYVIANRRIWEPGKGWSAYAGTDPHTGHLHLSVKTTNGDDPTPWKLGGEMNPYNGGDASNISQLFTDVSLGEAKGKKDWNDVFYAIVKPHIQALQEENARLKAAQSDDAARKAIDALNAALKNK